MKPWKENRETLQDAGKVKNLWRRPQKVQETKAKVDKWNFIKLKCSCAAKEIIVGLKSIIFNGRESQ